jgi:MFS family permease
VRDRRLSSASDRSSGDRARRAPEPSGDSGGRGWIVVAASVVIVGVSIGSLFSLGVFIAPMEEAMTWSRSQISSVALLAWVTLGVGSFLWGMLADRVGTRLVVGAGGLALGLGLVSSSQVQALWQFSITFGVLVGAAVGAFYAPLTATVSHWFRVNRGLAVALVSAGTGLGTFGVAPLTRWLISQYDWRVAMLVLGDLVWLTIVPLAFVVRAAPGGVDVDPTRGPHPDVDRDLSLGDVWRTPQFWLIAWTHFTCCTAHAGPIFHMVANATARGVGPMTAATVFGVAGLASIGGRVLSGLVADRLGSKRTLVVMLALQAPAILLYVLARDVVSFYALALFFGVAYGGVMPLYALLTREYFGPRAMSGAYGAIYALQAIGMGLGTVAGGWFYDTLGGYGWFFVTASAIAAGAVLLALPLRRPRLAVTFGHGAEATAS